MRQKTQQSHRVDTKYFAFDGGLNLVDPPLETKDGMVLGAQNYELAVRGGYRRITGFERFDGQQLPSNATYTRVDFDTGTLEPVVGIIVAGATSLAHGHLLEINLVTGTWIGGDAAGTMIVHTHASQFVNDEQIVEGNQSTTLGFTNGFR